MTRAPGDTSDTLTRARMSALVRPKKARRAGHPSLLFAPKKGPPVTLTCSSCGNTITLEIPGAAYCRPCRQAMRPEGEGGKRRERAQHDKNPHAPRPKRGSNRPITHARGGLETWHARP